MRRHLAIIVTALAALAALAPPTFATTLAAAIPGLDRSTLVPVLIPVLVPVVIALLKWAVGRMPKWLLPILAPLLGAAADIASSYATGTALGPVWAAALGLAGVGLREIVDQARKAVAPY